LNKSGGLGDLLLERGQGSWAGMLLGAGVTTPSCHSPNRSAYMQAR